MLEKLHHELGAFTLWSHEETGNGWAYRRDIAVVQWCVGLKSRDGWAKLRDERMSAPIISAPQSIVAVKDVETHSLPDKNHSIFGLQPIGSVQIGGRKEGIKTLDSFLKERGRNYMQTISKPGVSARHCSRLSAHITFGTLSVREVEQATKAKIHSLAGNNDPDVAFFRRNLSAFLSRLAWHCHFIQKLE